MSIVIANYRFPPNALTALIKLPPNVGLFSNALSFAYLFS